MDYADTRAEAPSAIPGWSLDERALALLSGMRDCACGLDTDLRIVWANPQAARQVGLRMEEALGQPIFAVLPKAVGSPFETLVRRALAEGAPQWADYLSSLTGTWVEMRAIPVSGGLVLVWNDLSEQREREVALRRTLAERDAALAQLTAVLDILPVGVGIAEDATATAIRANPALQRMMGVRSGSNISCTGPDEAARPAVAVLRNGRPLANEDLPIQECVRSGRPVPTAQYTLVRGDGVRVAISGSAAPLHDGEGRLVGAVGCFTDISRFEAVLSAAEAEAAFLSALGDTVPGMLWATDTKGRFEYGNRAVEDYFGRGIEALDLSVWWQAAHAEHAVAVAQAWAQARDTGDAVELEYPIRGHDGVHRWFLVRATSRLEGAARRWIGIALDVTERKRDEEQVRDTQRLQAVGKLAGGVAHEVNNQMTVVIGMATLASKRLEPDHPAQTAISHITAAGTRAASITRQLLAFSRRQLLQPVLLDLNALLLAFQPVLERIVGASIPVTLELSAGRPTVRADRGQLEQVLVNLASNSRDAIAEGGRLTVSTARVSDGYVRRRVPGASVRRGAWVALRVADDGAGMPAEVRARAFEPFFTTRGPGEGTGLGLATVYGIVTQSGGLLALESTPGSGTALTIFLPAAEPGADEVPVGAGPVAETPDDGAPVAPVRGTVILAEDEPGVRALVAEVLADAGFDVLAASSGRGALRLASDLAEPPALVVTDVVMPDMGGNELVARLRERWRAPVLYVSGYAWEEVVRRGLLDAQGPFLEKPFRPEALLAAVHRLLAVPADAG